MSKRRVQHMADVEPEMNVTPLVDIVLVLLIVFMVVAPRLEHDVQVNLPDVFNPDPELEMVPAPLKVTIASGGAYYVDERRYDLDQMIDYLSNAHAEDPLRRLLLRADSDLAYGRVHELFARAQKVGFPGIALMVGERHRHSPVAGRPEN